MFLSRFQLGVTAMVLGISSVALPQNKIGERTVVVDGESKRATVYEIEGHNFIDLEELAKLAPRLVQIQGDHLILSSTPLNQDSSSCADKQSKDVPLNEMSSSFMAAASEALGQIQEWRTVMSSALAKGVPGDGSNLVRWEARAVEAVRLASIAESTEGDRTAYRLLSNDLDHMSAWHHKILDARKKLNTADYTMSQDKLTRDAEFQKVMRCSELLGNVLSTKKLSDDGSCR